MKWTKLKVHVNPIAVEAVSDMVLGLGIEGIEIEDNLLTEEDKALMFVNYVDASIVPLEEHRVIAYLDESMDVEALKVQIVQGLEHIRQFLEVGSGKLTVEEMPDEDYENKWKEFYQPFRVGKHMVITPIWEEPEIDKEDVLIRIDPGMAFGSGTHETTSLCVEFLQAMDLQNEKVVDVGCGSGILGIVASKLGAEKVWGIDIDENAVTIARENLISNDVQGVMSVEQGNLLDNITEAVHVVVANILADVIMLIAAEVHQVLLDDGHFIASGILISRAAEVQENLLLNGFKVLEVKEKGEWAAILAMKV